MSDVNDNSPVFQMMERNITLSESLSVGTPILNLVAIDSDFGSNGLVNYTILSEEYDGSVNTSKLLLAGMVCASKALDVCR